MLNLNLWANGNVVHSIPRKDIGIELDFKHITETFISSINDKGWSTTSLKSSDEIVTDLFFKEPYIAECAYLLWGYFLKEEIKKVS